MMATETLINKFVELRSYLWAVAYDMTGEIHEAEDIVQDAFEAVNRLQDNTVTNPKAYFTRIVVNKSIDRLKELQVHRVNYPGPWLPEPVVTPPGESGNEHTLDYAIMHIAEQLNPIERAVFILREAFDYSYAEIAELCDISEANCRQILHRARGKMRENKQHFVGDHRNIDSLLNAFVHAAIEEDHDSLKALLREDIKLYSDGGGKAVAARNVLHGPENVSKFVVGISRRIKSEWLKAVPVLINNAPGRLIYYNGAPHLLFMIDESDAGVAEIFIVRNPEKISLKNLSQNEQSVDI